MFQSTPLSRFVRVVWCAWELARHGNAQACATLRQRREKSAYPDQGVAVTRGVEQSEQVRHERTESARPAIFDIPKHLPRGPEHRLSRLLPAISDAARLGIGWKGLGFALSQCSIRVCRNAEQ
jgi:hypothetical protein